jgi:hypothetical protein
MNFPAFAKLGLETGHSQTDRHRPPMQLTPHPTWAATVVVAAMALPDAVSLMLLRMLRMLLTMKLPLQMTNTTRMG